MLTWLRESLMRDEQETFIGEAMLESSNKSIKDILLNDLDTITMGAEDDPEIARLISKIPEYEEIDTRVEAEIEKVIESISETLI